MGIADYEGNLVVDDDGDVESGYGFGSRSEFGLGEVPVYVSGLLVVIVVLEGELFGAVFVPKKERFDVKVEGRDIIGVGVVFVVVSGGGVVEEEVQMEGAAEEGAGPRKSKEAYVCVVKGGG